MPIADAGVEKNQIASVPVIIGCDCQVEPNGKIISGSHVFAVA